MTSTAAPGTAIELQRWLLRARDESSLGRRPLGEREAVATALGESLPRLTFDASGKGTYTRGKAELIVQLVGRPVTAVELTMRAEHVSAFRPALERITTKGGWQLFDPDRSEVIFPPEPVSSHREPGGGRGVLWWAIPTVGVLAAIGWAGGWIPVRSSGHAATQSGSPAASESAAVVQKALENMLSGAAAGSSGPAASPQDAQRAAAALVAQVQIVGEFLRRSKMVSAEFRTRQVVNEMIMIGVAETAFQMTAGGGRFVDPAALADRAINPPGKGLPVLPEAFAVTERGGYRFVFTGYDEGPAVLPEFKPAYASFVYVAWPQSAQAGPHTFALHSDTGRIHYTTDGRSPTPNDPSVTDAAEGQAAR